MSLGAAALGLLALLGCGSGIEGPPGDRGVFEKHFLAFEAASRKYGRDTRGDGMISIHFGALDKHEAGRCEWSFLGGRIVLISETSWKALNDSGREALVFHELGHCLLHRDHRDERFEITELREEDDMDLAGSPKSVMNKNCLSGEAFRRWRDYYIDELFHPGEAAPERAVTSPEPEPTATPTPTPTPAP